MCWRVWYSWQQVLIRPSLGTILSACLFRDVFALFREPTPAEVEEHLDKYFPALKGDRDRTARIKQILEIMKTTNRYLLHVYQLDGEKSMSETMFQAIFSGTKMVTLYFHILTIDWIALAYKDNPDDAKRARLLDLSIRWNFLDGAKELLEVNNTRREKSGQTKVGKG